MDIPLELPPEEMARVALEEDHEFLHLDGVFTEDLTKVWLDYKREREIDAVRLRPHSYEFFLYFDA